MRVHGSVCARSPGLPTFALPTTICEYTHFCIQVISSIYRYLYSSSLYIILWSKVRKIAHSCVEGRSLSDQQVVALICIFLRVLQMAGGKKSRAILHK